MFEGKKVYYTYDGNEVTGVVVMADYDIGVSIVNELDDKDFLLCVHGPSSPIGKFWHGRDEERYNKAWFTILRLIEFGWIDKSIFESDLFDQGSFAEDNPTEDDCPFY
jgi:hypothetical protein